MEVQRAAVPASFGSILFGTVQVPHFPRQSHHLALIRWFRPAPATSARTRWTAKHSTSASDACGDRRCSATGLPPRRTGRDRIRVVHSRTTAPRPAPRELALALIHRPRMPCRCAHEPGHDHRHAQRSEPARLSSMLNVLPSAEGGKRLCERLLPAENAREQVSVTRNPVEHGVHGERREIEPRRDLLPAQRRGHRSAGSRAH